MSSSTQEIFIAERSGPLKIKMSSPGWMPKDFAISIRPNFFAEILMPEFFIMVGPEKKR